MNVSIPVTTENATIWMVDIAFQFLNERHMHTESSNDPLNLLIKYAKRVISFNCRTGILNFLMKNPSTKGQTIQRPG